MSARKKKELSSWGQKARDLHKQGICTRCRKVPAVKGRWHCKDCAEIVRTAARERARANHEEWRPGMPGRPPKATSATNQQLRKWINELNKKIATLGKKRDKLVAEQERRSNEKK